MPDSSPLLSVHQLGRKLGDAYLWRGVSFALNPGDWLGLVAASGAGKTLLMRNLVLLDPIHEGEVWFEGRSLADWHLPTYRTQVIYLSQRATPWPGTVEDNLRHVFTLNAHRQCRYDPDRVRHWLAQVGRDNTFLQRQASQLSGGEMQLLALVRSLQLDPTILLLDEPTASLDPDTTHHVEALLKTWLAQPNHACLFTSHDPTQVERLTSRQLHLADFQGSG